MMVPIFLIGANAIGRAGLGRILAEEGFNVALSVASVNNLVNLRDQRSLAIIDNAPLEDQPDIVRAAAALCSSIRPVVLSSSFDIEAMTGCFSAGAEGYLINDMGIAALAASLRLIANGQKVMPSILVDQLTMVSSASARPQNHQTLDSVQLSQREHDVLRSLIVGLSNKDTARQLNVSEATVKIHIKGVLRKLKVANRTQAAMWAIARGIDPTTPHELSAEAAVPMLTPTGQSRSLAGDVGLERTEGSVETSQPLVYNQEG